MFVCVYVPCGGHVLSNFGWSSCGGHLLCATGKHELVYFGDARQRVYEAIHSANLGGQCLPPGCAALSTVRGGGGLGGGGGGGGGDMDWMQVQQLEARSRSDEDRSDLAVSIDNLR